MSLWSLESTIFSLRGQSPCPELNRQGDMGHSLQVIAWVMKMRMRAGVYGVYGVYGVQWARVPGRCRGRLVHGLGEMHEA